MATLKHGAFDHVAGDELHLVSLFLCAAGFQAGSLGRHLVCFFLLTHAHTRSHREVENALERARHAPVPQLFPWRWRGSAAGADVGAEW